MNISIPFRPGFREPMITDMKVMTFRSKKYGEPGDTFEMFGAKFVLTHVMRMVLKHVAADCFRQEGCVSQDAFEIVWRSIHPRAHVDREMIGWAHCFRRTSAQGKP